MHDRKSKEKLFERSLKTESSEHRHLALLYILSLQDSSQASVLTIITSAHHYNTSFTFPNDTQHGFVSNASCSEIELRQILRTRT